MTKKKKDQLKLIYMHEEILRIILFYSFIITILATVINVFDRRPLTSVLGPIIVSLVLFSIYHYLKSHTLTNILRYGIVIMCCFVFFPIQWLVSRGATGTMPFYSFLFLSLLVFFADNKIEKFFISLFFIQIFSLIAFEAYNPTFFLNSNERPLEIHIIFYHYFIVALGLVLILYSVYRYLKQLQQRLYELTVIDDLTQVYNRRFLIEKLNELINEASRENVDFHLIFIDINQFKQINDTYGHPMGDDVLITLGQILRDATRNYDIPTRYGGDEFIILLPRSTTNSASSIAERIIGEFSMRIYNNFGITSSLAIGISNGKGKTLDALLKESDDRMYKDKTAVL